MRDVVFPQGNEKKLVAMAKRLGFTEVLFCYSVAEATLARKKDVEGLTSETLAVGFAVFVETQKEVQQAIRLTKNVVGLARRELFDNKRVRYLINAESGERTDFIHHRNSGLTQVLLSLAKRKDKTILVNFRQLRENTPVVLGRMLQNNRFYKKYEPNVIVVSGARQALEMRAPRDLQNILSL